MAEPIEDLITYFWSQWQDIFNNFHENHNCCYQIGPKTVTLNFSNLKLQEKLQAAQAHLITELNQHFEPVLEIYIWDLVSQQQGLPLILKKWFREIAAQPEKYLGAKGEILGGKTQDWLVSFNAGNGTFYIYNKTKRTAFAIFKDANLIPYYDSGAPLKILWHWLAQDMRNVMIHGGAVGTEEESVLLVGRGGSGKSTSTLACVGHPILRYLGDDYCLISLDSEIKVHSLFNSVKLVGTEDLERFPFLANYFTNLDQLEHEKALGFVNDFSPTSLQISTPLKAVCVPKITGSPETTWCETSSSKALLSSAPSSIFQLPYTDASHFQKIAEIVNNIPCYQINLGTDISQIPNAIIEILENA